MVLKLRELLIKKIAINLAAIRDEGRFYLTSKQRELVLQWLSNHDYLTQDITPHIMRHLITSQLYEMNFYKCTQLTDQMLIEFSTSQFKLKKLTIHKCDQVSDGGIRAITKNQRALEYVALRKQSRLTDQGLTELNSAFLREIDLRSNEKIKDNGILSLVSNNLNLRCIRLVNCYSLTGQCVIYIAEHLADKLEILDVEGLKYIDDISFAHLVNYCPNIRSLNLFGINSLNGDGLFTLFTRVTNMQQLNLSYTNCFSQKSMADYLCFMPSQLVDLCLSGTQLYDSQTLIRALIRLNCLEHLRLNGLSTVTDDGLKKILEVIGSQLKTIELNGYITVEALTDKGVEHVVRYCNSLRHLSLNLLSFTATLDSLYDLFSSKTRSLKLRTVLLSSARNINPNVIWKLVQNCPNLEHIDLSGIQQIDDSVLGLLKHCEKLSHLSIKGCKQITDDSLCELLSNCKFRCLILSGCFRLTDKSIFAMANSQPYLEEIYISGCVKISPVAVRYLQDCAVRRIFIDHKIPNCDPNQLMARNLDTGLFECVS